MNYFSRLIVQSGLQVEQLPATPASRANLSAEPAISVHEQDGDDFVELAEVVELSPPQTNDVAAPNGVASMEDSESGDDTFDESKDASVDIDHPIQMEMQAAEDRINFVDQTKPDNIRAAEAPSVPSPETKVKDDSPVLQTLRQVIEWIAADPIYREKENSDQPGSQSRPSLSDEHQPLKTAHPTVQSQEDRALIRIDNKPITVEDPPAEMATEERPAQWSLPAHAEKDHYHFEAPISQTPSAEPIEEIIHLSIGSINVNVETATSSPSQAVTTTVQTPPPQANRIFESTATRNTSSRLRRRYLRL